MLLHAGVPERSNGVDSFKEAQPKELLA